MLISPKNQEDALSISISLNKNPYNSIFSDSIWIQSQLAERMKQVTSILGEAQVFYRTNDADGSKKRSYIQIMLRVSPERRKEIQDPLLFALSYFSNKTRDGFCHWLSQFDSWKIQDILVKAHLYCYKIESVNDNSPENDDMIYCDIYEAFSHANPHQRQEIIDRLARRNIIKKVDSVTLLRKMLAAKFKV